MSEHSFEAFKQWMIERGRDPSTAEEYIKDLKVALDHPQGPLGRLRQRNLAPKTLRRTMASLRAWCKFTKDNEFLNQLSDIRLPPDERASVKMPLTEKEWSALLDEVNNAEYLTEPERAVIGIMAVRGMRVGDVLRMSWRDLQNALSTGVLSFEAKRRKRTEYGIKQMRPYLEILAKEQDWEQVYHLLGDRRRGRVKFASASMAVSRALKDVGRKIGVPPKELHPHRLRRTCAVYYLRAVGGDIEKLRAWMDWESIETAQNYVDFHKREELDDVADKMIQNTKDMKEKE
jgi:integrase